MMSFCVPVVSLTQPKREIIICLLLYFTCTQEKSCLDVVLRSESGKQLTVGAGAAEVAFRLYVKCVIQ
jgi:hypothetical protein